ncbi:anti-sigma factor [Sneathiella sp.]|uniref:anti-sigma factor n=1 Tax=Sneathiella sp. TaxID=1964365 RepID=UPI0025E1CFFD|nr:anti-sigma factor [Sneathiella sp.]
MNMDKDNLARLADEYVLGLLEPLEAEAVETEMQTNIELAKAVGHARDRFLPLDMTAPEAVLRDGFAETVKQSLDADPGPETRAPKVVPMTTRGKKSSWLSRQVFWPAAAAAAIGIIIGSYLPFNKPDPVVVAVLLDANGVAQAIVEDYGNSTAQIRFVSDVDVPADKTLQLWTLPSPETGPVSLGILPGVRPAVVDGPDLPQPKPQQLYEVTLEPLGGSPTGKPTGPILGKGLAVLQKS